MSDYEEMLAVFKAGFRARFDAPGLLKPEGDEAIRAGIRAVVERWRNNFDNAQLQITDLSAEVEKLKVVLGDGVRMAAAMNMTAGWVDSAKQILGGKS